jgi:CheY-like chemotaxis protein
MLSTRFIGNAGRIRQIVLNYVSNAIKFTDEGSVIVRVNVQQQDHERASVRIEVADTGRGVPPEVQPRLFQKFVQADSSTTRRCGGTGLGLAISKSLAELMGGAVGLTSQPGRGSEFFVELPLALETRCRKDQTCFTADVTSLAAALPGDDYRILLVEDNAVNQNLAARLLSKAGFRVDVAANGSEAVDMYRTLPYDLILMDCQMPVMDGYEATKLIRSLPTGAHVPVLAVTAHAGEEQRHRCLSAGMDDVVSKPFRGPDLVRAVRSWILRAGIHPPHLQNDTITALRHPGASLADSCRDNDRTSTTGTGRG